MSRGVRHWTWMMTGKVDFSPRTVLAAVEAFGFNTNAQVENLALEYGLADILGNGGIAKKESRLARYLVEHPELTGYGGTSLVHELIERAIEARCRQAWRDPQDPAEVLPALVHSLKQDGFVIEDGELVRLLPEVVPVAAAQDELTQLLHKHGFETAIGHLDQVLSAHARGDWAAANGQLRTFVEELFNRIADHLSDGTTQGLATSHARREWLATCDPPFLVPEMNEWDPGKAGGFVQGLWKRLHPGGSHPGLSDEADSSFRLHVVLIVAEHFMKRFDARIT